MLDGADVIFLYDGSFEGLLCCIFESYEKKTKPYDIIIADQCPCTLFKMAEIETDKEKAKRVKKGLIEKVSWDAFYLVQNCYYSCYPQKEMLILEYVYKCFSMGKKVLSALADDTVNAINKAVLSLTREAHLFKEFVRFSIYDGAMVSVIEPKNFVLHIVAPHFCDRFPSEQFMIYDKTHKVAFVKTFKEKKLVGIDELKLPDNNKEEQYYEALWKMFYNTISIKERENHKCRISHMPKRFWKNMTEMQNVDKLLDK